MAKMKTVGRGLSERKEMFLGLGDNIDAPENRQYWWPEKVFGRIERKCKDFLRGLGLPCGDEEQGYIAREDGTWESLPDRGNSPVFGADQDLRDCQIRAGDKIRSGPWWGHHEEDSAPWLAANILLDIRKLRNSWPNTPASAVQIEPYDLRRMFQTAMRVAERYERMRWKTGHEQAAVREHKAHEHRATGLHQAAVTKGQKKQGRIEAMSRWLREMKNENWLAINSDAKLAEFVRAELPMVADPDAWDLKNDKALSSRTLKGYVSEARRKELLPQRQEK